MFVTLIAAALALFFLKISLFGLRINILEMLTAIGVTAQLVGRHRGKSTYPIWRELAETGLMPALILLLIGAAVGVIIAPDKRAAIGILVGWFMTPLAVLWLAMATINSVNDLWWRLIRGYSLGAVIAALFAWYERATGHLLPYQQLDPTSFHDYLLTHRAFGSFESPNFLAMLLVPAVIILVGDLLAHYHRVRTIWFWIIALMLIVVSSAVFITGSFGGLIATVAGLVTLLAFGMARISWLSHRAKRLLLVATLTIMVLTAGLFTQIEVFQSSRLLSSLTIRQEIWSISRSLVHERGLFGVGLGNFHRTFIQWTAARSGFPAEIPRLALEPHQLYLAFFLETGLLGLIGFLWLVVIVIDRGISAFSRLPSPSATGVAALVSILVHGLIDTPFFHPALSVAFFLVVAIVMVSWKLDDHSKP